MIESIIILLLLIPLGRGAGGWYGDVYSKLCAPLIGMNYAFLLGVPPAWFPAFALAGWLAEKPDPAADSLGAVVDDWDVLKDWVKFIERGAIGAVPYLFLTPWFPTWWLLSFIVAWPAAVFLGTLLPNRDRHLPRMKVKHYFMYDAWEWSEMFRYFLAGLPLLFI